MTNSVVAISGKIGSGKSTLAAMVAKELSVTKVSFGDYVRHLATEKGIEPTRENLQTLGQEQVDADTQKFCNDVLRFANWKTGQSIVIDGVRHVEVLETLRKEVSPTPLKLVYLNPDEEIRQDRLTSRDGVSSIEITHFDNDRTEMENDELRVVADLVVNNTNEDSILLIKKLVDHH